jgi:RNA polymerase sigma-70 factor, ECF subfamily
LPDTSRVMERNGPGERGREDGFDRCFRAHYADVLAFALRRLRDRAAAEDVAAETFAIAWRRLERVPDPGLPWLYGIALNVIANQRRAATRQGNVARRLGSERSVAISPDPAELVVRRSSFATAFAKLGEEDREVLRLVAWDELTPREAAQALGCSHVAFRVRLHRARRRLGKHLDEAGHSTVEDATKVGDPAEEAG